jgi:lysine-specific demethylase 8
MHVNVWCSFLARHRHFSTNGNIKKQYQKVRTGDAKSFDAKEIFDANKPFQITGLVHDWPAVSSRSWREGFYENIGEDDSMVRVEQGRKKRTKDVRVAEVDFRSFARYCTAPLDTPNTSASSDLSERVFLAQCDLPESIKHDVIVPDMTKTTGKGHLYRINMWMCGGKGSESPCHHDPFHNLLCQVFGTKRVVLFPPDEGTNLYTASPPQTNTSMVDIDDPNLVLHPNFSKARERGVEALLSPGDALYIPLGHWHYCKADSSSCSVNFWWL